MAKPRVFVTRVIPDAGLEKIVEACDAEIWEDPLPPPHDVLIEGLCRVGVLVNRSD